MLLWVVVVGTGGGGWWWLWSWWAVVGEWVSDWVVVVDGWVKEKDGQEVPTSGMGQQKTSSLACSGMHFKHYCQ